MVLDELRGTVEPARATPLYHQVRLELQSWVERRLAPGEELPSELEIAEAFDVSRITVRQAVAELLADGVLYRPKSRSRLRRASVRVHQELTRLRGFFQDDVLAAGMDPSVTVLGKGLIRDDRIAEMLRVHPDTDIVRVERLHSGNSQPMTLQTSYFPHGPFPDLLAQDLSSSLFRLAAERYHLEMTGAQQRVYARACRAHESKVLHLPMRAPALVLERLSFTANRVPVEFFECCLRADSYDLTLTLGTFSGSPAAISAPPR